MGGHAEAMDFIRETLSTLPNFIAYILVGGGLQGLFFLIYLWLTPYRELALIRDSTYEGALEYLEETMSSAAAENA